MIICDKFKGCASSREINEHIAISIKNHFPEADIRVREIADGGEGTLDVIARYKRLKQIECTVSDPAFRPINGYYLSDGRTAYIEMAQASGLGLIEQSLRNPLFTTSYGTGQLVEHAINLKHDHIYLFVGGSATNDGGIGAATALGFRFYDKEGKEIIPLGQNLIDVHRIKRPQKKSLNKIKISLVTDVKNPMTGSSGATHIYARQKGADEEAVNRLENGMKNFQHILTTMTDQAMDIQGLGAAGGIGAVLWAFYCTEIVSGIDWMMAQLGIEEDIAWADWIITGEGQYDQSSLQGKVVTGISQRAILANKPVALLCGKSTINPASPAPFDYIDTLVNHAKNEENAINNWKSLTNKWLFRFLANTIK